MHLVTSNPETLGHGCLTTELRISLHPPTLQRRLWVHQGRKQHQPGDRHAQRRVIFHGMKLLKTGWLYICIYHELIPQKKSASWVITVKIINDQRIGAGQSTGNHDKNHVVFLFLHFWSSNTQGFHETIITLIQWEIKDLAKKQKC